MTAHNGQPLIHARDLVKRFGEFVAVDGIDFDLQRGEAFGFLGPNGAGKTSTMRMIGCVSPVTEGTLRVLGMDPARDGSKIRGRLGVVPQQDTLDMELTVRENLVIYGRYFDLSRREAGRRQVLIVDDDPEARRWLARALTAEGWEASEAGDGQTALERVRERRPDLILLDLLMPEMDGFEFLARLQADAKAPRVPVVVVTAADLTEDDHRRLNGAVEQVLLKQACSREELLRAVRDLVERAVPGRLALPEGIGGD